MPAVSLPVCWSITSAVPAVSFPACRCLCVGSKARSLAAGEVKCRVPPRRGRLPFNGEHHVSEGVRAERALHRNDCDGRVLRHERHSGPDGPSCLTTNTQTGSQRCRWMVARLSSAAARPRNDFARRRTSAPLPFYSSAPPPLRPSAPLLLCSSAPLLLCSSAPRLLRPSAPLPLCPRA